MKLEHIIYSLCIATLVFACANEPLPIDTTETLLQADSKGIANAPSESGMYVFRTETSFASIIVDFKTNLTTVNGWNIHYAVCNGDPLEFDIVPIQFIDIPNTDTRYIGLAQGASYSYVYDGAWDFVNGQDICDFFSNATLLAEGNTQIVATDNDNFADINSSPNKNAFGFRIHGRVTTPSDQIKNLLVAIEFLWDKTEYPNELIDIQVQASVQLH